MAVETWTPSRRLRSAALAERQRLEREQRRIDQRVAALQRELAELQAVQAEFVERRRVLDLVAPGAEGERTQDDAYLTARVGLPADESGGLAEVDAAPVAQPVLDDALRGVRIREVAVRLLAGSQRAQGALHYREWYRLLVDAGFSVAGKDPEASFLTQVGRSPVVHRSTQAGVYELDFEFIPRAREHLHRLRQELRSTHDLPEAAKAEELEAARAKRFALRDEIDALERQLQEALETLGDDQRESNE